MDRPKKKRNELELLLSNDSPRGLAALPGGFAAPSVAIPSAPVVIPSAPETPAETDEELARRLHAELNGTRARARARASKPVKEDARPVSPHHGGAPPQPRHKPDTPGKGGSGSAVTMGRASSGPSAIPQQALESTAQGGRDKDSQGARDGEEGVKRKRNAISPRELQTLFDYTPAVVTARAHSSQGEHQRAIGEAVHSGGGQGAPRRESDADGRRAQEGAGPTRRTSGSSGSAPAPPPPPPPPPPRPASLKQRYLAGLGTAAYAKPSQGAAPADRGGGNVSAGTEKPQGAQSAPGLDSPNRSGASGASATLTAATAVTPSCVLDVMGCSALSSQSLGGSGQASASVVAASTTGGSVSIATTVGSICAHPVRHASTSGTGAAGGNGAGCGCSSADEMDMDHDGAATMAGTAPSATSFKGPFPEDEWHHAHAAVKVPKLPMVRAGRGWYRGRLLREGADGRVLVEVPGAPLDGSATTQQSSIWLPANAERIWRGSYKGKDWKYLGDGAWEPKPCGFKRGKDGSSPNGLPLPLPSWAEGATPAPLATDAGTQPLPSDEQKGGSGGHSIEREALESMEGIKPEPEASMGPSCGPEVLQPQRSECSPPPAADVADEHAQPAEDGPAADVSAAVGDERVADADGVHSGDADPVPTASNDVKMEEHARTVSKDADEAQMVTDVGAPEELAAVGSVVAAAEACASVAAMSCAADATALVQSSGDTHWEAVDMAVDADGGQDDAGDEVEIWVPGLSFPRKHAPRRAQARRGGLQVPWAWPTEEESAGEAPCMGLDADDTLLGRRASDGAIEGTAFHGNRRRAAARAAAVAAAAARAEMEVEEEEQEAAVLTGKRQPRRDRDRFQAFLQHHQGGMFKRHALHHMPGRSQGDSGSPEEEDGHGSVRNHGDVALRSGLTACGAAEYGSAAGGSPAPEYGSWHAGARSGGGAGLHHHQSSQPRNRRKGKPSRARVNGEDHAWCWEGDQELGVYEVWMRMPETLRQLYYISATTESKGEAGATSAGGHGGDARNSASAHKRRRCGYDEYEAFPEDVDESMDHDNYHSLSYGGGSRAAACGGGFMKRRRDPDTEAYRPRAHSNGGAGGGSWSDAPVQPRSIPRQRILTCYGPPVGGSQWEAYGSMDGAEAGAAPRSRYLSGIDGLLEAAILSGELPRCDGNDCKRQTEALLAQQVHAGCVAAAADRQGHVSLSDSSGAGVGAVEGCVPVPTGLEAAAPGQAAACGSIMAEGCPLRGPASGVSSGSGGIPLQLRPGTPTRARRTGRPQLGAMPKLPALSSTASLRLQVAAAGASGATESTGATHEEGAAAAVPSAAGAGAESAGPSGAVAHQDGEETNGSDCAAGAVPNGMMEVDVPIGSAQQDGTPAAQQPTSELPEGTNGLAFWQSSTDPTPSPLAPPQLQHGVNDGPSAMGDNPPLPEEFQARASDLVSAPASGSEAGSLPLGLSPIGSPRPSGGFPGPSAPFSPRRSSSSVLDAIGELAYDKQPAMQQVVLRAQSEVDSMSAAASVKEESQRWRSPQRNGRSSSGALARSMSGAYGGANGAGVVEAAPLASEALLAALPRLDLVVALYSSRAPFGGAQQALTELVGGVSTVPMFQ